MNTKLKMPPPNSLEMVSKNDSGLHLNRKLPKLDYSFHFINSSISTKVLPGFFANKKYISTLVLYKQFINNRLNIINILKKLEMIQINSEVLKKCSQEMSINNNYLIKQKNSKINNFISSIK